jgi:hypothetical protein
VAIGKKYYSQHNRGREQDLFHFSRFGIFKNNQLPAK